MTQRLCFILCFFLSTSALGSAGSGVLGKAEDALNFMNYPQVIALTDSVLKSPKSSEKDRIKAFELQAYALVILGDVVSAEENFHAILKHNPKFRLPEDSSPKLLQVFSKAYLDFEAQQKQLFEEHLESMRKTVRLSDETTTELVGGEPLTFRFTLEDPQNHVKKIMLAYRKRAEEDYSAQPLELNQQTGKWETVLSSEWTENKEGMEVEYFLSSRDARDYPMQNLYSIKDPNFLIVKPGLLSANLPFYQRYWFWGTVGAVVGTAALTYMLLQNEANRCDLPPCIKAE